MRIFIDGIVHREIDLGFGPLLCLVQRKKGDLERHRIQRVTHEVVARIPDELVLVGRVAAQRTFGHLRVGGYKIEYLHIVVTIGVGQVKAQIHGCVFLDADGVVARHHGYLGSQILLGGFHAQLYAALLLARLVFGQHLDNHWPGFQRVELRQ